MVLRNFIIVFARISFLDVRGQEELAKSKNEHFVGSEIRDRKSHIGSVFVEMISDPVFTLKFEYLIDWQI